MKKQKSEFTILALNPGSTSTKIGVFKNENQIFEATVRHSTKVLEQYTKIWDQYTFRKDEIIQTLEANNLFLSELDAVVGRGGLIKPIPSGVYYIDEEMIQDARIGYQGQHASNLGCVIAYSIGWEFGIPSYIVDPPAVDDFEPLARISGYAEIERKSLLHALNVFATSRIFAKEHGKSFENLNLIVAHLGGGISVSAVKNGKAINANNGIDEGPFTPERSGSLPMIQFIKLCLSGKYSEPELRKIIAGKGGLVSYFNTNKAHEVEAMALAGSEKFRLVYEAMAYQIAQEIGARATNLHGKVDAIIITGGIAHSDLLCKWIEERVSFIAKVHRYPGELELEALAYGVLRVLRGEESSKSYQKNIRKIGIYYWDNLEMFVSAINNIEERLREKGFSFRKDNANLEIIYADCNKDEDKARLLLENLEQRKVDVIFALGTPSSIRAAQYLKNKDIPVVCTGIYNTTIFSSQYFSNRTNFYASTYGLPIAEQIENTILKISPQLKKLGFVYKIGEMQSDIQHDEVNEFCIKNNIKLISYDIQNSEDFASAAEYFIEQKADWIFIGASTMVADAPSRSIDVIFKKIPTYCVIENNIYQGGLISYVAGWKQVSINAADLAIKLLNKSDIAEKLIHPEKKYIIANKETAEKLGLLTKIQELENLRIV